MRRSHSFLFWKKYRIESGMIHTLSPIIMEVENDSYIWKVTTVGGTHYWLLWLWEEDGGSVKPVVKHVGALACFARSDIFGEKRMTFCCQERQFGASPKLEESEQLASKKGWTTYPLVIGIREKKTYKILIFLPENGWMDFFQISRNRFPIPESLSEAHLQSLGLELKSSKVASWSEVTSFYNDLHPTRKKQNNCKVPFNHGNLRVPPMVNSPLIRPYFLGGDIT